MGRLVAITLVATLLPALALLLGVLLLATDLLPILTDGAVERPLDLWAGEERQVARVREPVSDAELVAEVRAACPAVLGRSAVCRTLPVTVAELGGDQAGEAGYEERFTDDGGERGTITATGITIASDLRTDHPEFVRHVAVHEWWHVRTYLRTANPAALRAATDRANAYFTRRAGREMFEDQGIELATDCATVLATEVDPGPDREETTGYVQEYLPDATDMKDACGSGWRRLLP